MCLFASIAIVGCANDEDKARRLEKKAIVAVEEERLDDAVALYRDIVDRFPQTSTAYSAQDRITFLSGLAQSVTSFPGREARDLMVETARAVQSYRWSRGRWPDNLDDLVPKRIDEAPIDPWGRPLIYQRRKNGYRLACLGADGREGGSGEATDFVVVNGDFVSDPSGGGPF